MSDALAYPEITRDKGTRDGEESRDRQRMNPLSPPMPKSRYHSRQCLGRQLVLLVDETGICAPHLVLRCPRTDEAEEPKRQRDEGNRRCQHQPKPGAAEQLNR
jgi:hypothetical protein